MRLLHVCRSVGRHLLAPRARDDRDELAADTASYVEQHHPYVDVVVHEGGQDRYPLLVSVE